MTGTTEHSEKLPPSKIQNLRNRLGLKWDDLSPEERREVLNQLFFEGYRWRPYLFRFITLLSLSVAIAAFGLLSDSGAVVIGAMLVAPLMTPILAIAAALVMGWPGRQLRSAMLVAGACVLAVSFAWVIGKIAPDSVGISGQILNRTNPTLLDLGIAIAAGGAGAYTLVRKESSAIPGVAIAVALVPPLTVVGLTLEEGQTSLALGALLLFGTNLVAIIFAASTVFLITGFTPRLVVSRASRRIRWGISITIIAVILISVPLGIHSRAIIHDARSEHFASQAVEEWAIDSQLHLIDINIDDQQVVVDVAGPESPPSVDILADDLVTWFGPGLEVTVRWIQRFEEVVQR